MSEIKKIRQQFQVNFDFDLIFTRHLFNTNNSTLLDLLSPGLATKSKALVVVDQGVSNSHPNLKKTISEYFDFHNTIELSGSVLEIPGGEQVKNDEKHVKQLLDAINQFGIDRHSYVIAIGGGAVLDAVGFAAAIAHRGVRLVRIPTTVLSQNDSGVGVKNGINYFGKKNFVGSFAAPYAIINDDVFLTTLDDRNWRSGISEAIKVALIKDLDFFNWIENHTSALSNRDADSMNELIYRCAEMHMDHIRTSGDPFEQGSSRPLDFGHWAAHKLEQVSSYKILHGEAVAVGIALDSTYSYLKGYLNENEIGRILDCFLNLGFTISYNELNELIISGLEEFREHLGGKLTIMLLKSLGKGFEVHEIDENLVLESISYISKYCAQKITL
jgi:3-dehydroquinate synthase